MGVVLGGCCPRLGQGRQGETLSAVETRGCWGLLGVLESQGGPGGCGGEGRTPLSMGLGRWGAFFRFEEGGFFLSPVQGDER